MSTWHYVKNGQKCGPVEAAELQTLLSQEALPPSTLVWKKGMANWATASSLPEFSDSCGAPAIPTMEKTAPSGGETGASDVEKNKIMAVLGYLGILFIIPLLAARQSRFAMYHTNQGIVLFIAWWALIIVSSIIASIPFIGWLVSLLIIPIFSLGALILVILGIVNAVNGVCKPLPLIGERFTLVK